MDIINEQQRTETDGGSGGSPEGGLSLAEAGRVMVLSYRQAKRVWQRFKKAGDAGLVHRSRGRPGARRKEAKFRQRVLARYEERYPDFGPTLAAEKLGEEGLGVDHETLRRWLLEKGLWQVGRKRQRHRAWRERVGVRFGVRSTEIKLRSSDCGTCFDGER